MFHQQKYIAGAAICAMLLLFSACQKPVTTNNTPMKISSTAFANEQLIPAAFTCDGRDINPALQISDVPADSKSLALIVDDPDAPVGDWVHWLVWNIRPDTAEIAENSVPAGAVLGTTDYGKPGWGGPCPPSGVHRYYFKLYALDSELNLPASAKKKDLETAIENHVLASAELMGKYSRK